MKIQILTDSSSWMNKHNLILADNLTALGHETLLIHCKEKLVKGEVAFFLSCFEIIGEEYLTLHNRNIVVHASDLPKGKGWSPATWQILEGKNEITLTLFEATKKCDAGDVYLKDILQLNGLELLNEWQEKLGDKIITMCCQFVKQYNTISSEKQSHNNETFYPKRVPDDSMLDIDKSISEQFNLLRVVDNDKYPAFFKINGICYKVKIYKEEVNE